MKKVNDLYVKELQANFTFPVVKDLRVELPVARAFLMAGRFTRTFGGNVLHFEPKATHLGCGVYQLTAKRV